MLNFGKQQIGSGNRGGSIAALVPLTVCLPPAPFQATGGRPRRIEGVARLHCRGVKCEHDPAPYGSGERATARKGADASNVRLFSFLGVGTQQGGAGG